MDRKQREMEVRERGQGAQGDAAGGGIGWGGGLGDRRGRRLRGYEQRQE